MYAGPNSIFKRNRARSHATRLWTVVRCSLSYLQYTSVRCDPIPHITLRSTVNRALYTDVRPTLTACRQKPGRGRGAGDRNVSGPRKGTGSLALLSACRTLGSRPAARSSGIRCVGGRSGELRGTTGPKRGETSMSGLSRLPPPPVISGGNSEAADTSQRWSGGRPFTGVSRGTLQRCARSCSASRA